MFMRKITFKVTRTYICMYVFAIPQMKGTTKQPQTEQCKEHYKAHTHTDAHMSQSEQNNAI